MVGLPRSTPTSPIPANDRGHSRAGLGVDAALVALAIGGLVLFPAGLPVRCSSVGRARELCVTRGLALAARLLLFAPMARSRARSKEPVRPLFGIGSGTSPAVS